MIALVVHAQYEGGSGTATDPYLIATTEQFFKLAESPDDYEHHFILCSDLDLSCGHFTGSIIASTSINTRFDGTAFTGVFDGAGHRISDFKIASEDRSYASALFGQLGPEGIIRNLEVRNGSISNAYYSAVLCAKNMGGTISNCWVSGLIHSPMGGGGIICDNNNGLIVDCRADGAVSGAGVLYSGMIDGQYGPVGGLCGRNFGQISNCLSIAQVTALASPGLYASGPVPVGAFCGDNQGVIRESFWNAELAVQREGGGGTGVTLSNMQDSAVFSGASWDFSTVWTMNGYPCPRIFSTARQTGITVHDGRSVDATGVASAQFYPEMMISLSCTHIDIQSETLLGWQVVPEEYADRISGNRFRVPPVPVALYPVVADGVGSESDPVKIRASEQLMALAKNPENWDRSILLTADMDLGAYTFASSLFAPVRWHSTSSFTGIFDGGGHVISRFTLDGGANCAFFEQIGTPGEVRNLALSDARVTGWSVTAALCGLNEGTISACWSSGSVSGSNTTGGLCAQNNGTIRNSYSIGNVSGSYIRGGLCGINRGVIQQAYSSVAVVQEPELIAADMDSRVSGSTSKARSVIITTPSNYSGGLCGQNTGTIEHSYWNSDASQEYSAHGTGISTKQMQVFSTFPTWDFTDVWEMMDRPVLKGFPALPTYAAHIESGAACDLNGRFSEGFAAGTFISLSYTNRVTPGEAAIGWQVSPLQYAQDVDQNAFVMPACSVSFVPRVKPCFHSGFGIAEQPYCVASVDEFMELVSYPILWGQCFELAQSIDLADRTFDQSPLAPSLSSASYDFAGTEFSGSFDGAGHVISNLTIQSEGTSTALFGQTSGTASIFNLGLENCSVSNNGLTYVVAGLVGVNKGAISSCYTTGQIASRESYVGGVCGWNEGGQIKNCYSSCSVSGDIGVGGICGYNYRGSVACCYATGPLHGNRLIGGVCGLSNGGVSNCFWDIETSGVMSRAEAHGQRTAVLRNRDTYSAWDFDQVWRMSDYPSLQAFSAPETYEARFCGALAPYGRYAAGRRVVLHAPADYCFTGWTGDIDCFEDEGLGCTTATVIMPAHDISVCARSTFAFDNPDGTGLSQAPFEIADATQFMHLANNPEFWDQHYHLTADIDLSSVIFSAAAVGPGTRSERMDGAAFAGVLDGCGHRILNLSVISDESNSALVGTLAEGGIIRNLGIEEASVISSGDDSSLLCGKNLGTISNCWSKGRVTGGSEVGGLCGRNAGDIANCYSMSDVAGRHIIGGFCGYNDYGNISNCYAVGTAVGELAYNVAGFNGFLRGNISNCFWDTQVASLTKSYGGTGKTSTELQLKETYHGWDFGTEWAMSDTYPVLQRWMPQTNALFNGYARWAQGIDNPTLRDPTATCGSHSVPNLLKYACGFSPEESFDVSRVLRVSLDGPKQNPDWVITFFRNPNAQDTSLNPVCSTDLNSSESWTQERMTLFRTGAIDIEGREEWKAIIPSHSSAAFFRLKATLSK